MLEFLIDNIFVSFGGTLFQQVVGIPMGTNCAPLLADLFLYSYESEFLQKLVKIRRFMRLEPLISHTGILMTFYLSIILDLQNFFHWYIFQSWKLKRPQIQLRPHHFWTYTSNLTTVVNSVLKFMINGTTSNFKIINFPNMCSNIPASPAYGVYISQLIRYARASSNYSYFLKRHLHLRNRLLDQGYKKICLIRSLKKFIFRYQDLVEIYSVSAETMINNAFSYSENV